MTHAEKGRREPRRIVSAIRQFSFRDYQFTQNRKEKSKKTISQIILYFCEKKIREINLHRPRKKEKDRGLGNALKMFFGSIVRRNRE